MTIESIIISRVIPSLSQICNKFSAVAELITIIHDLQDRKIRHVWIRWVGIETTKFHRSKYQRKTELTRRDAITSNHSTNLRVSSSRFDQNTSFRFTTTILVEKYNSGKVRDGNTCKLIRRVLLHIHMYISSLPQKALGKENGTVDYSSRSRTFHVLPLPP